MSEKKARTAKSYRTERNMLAVVAPLFLVAAGAMSHVSATLHMPPANELKEVFRREALQQQIHDQAGSIADQKLIEHDRTPDADDTVSFPVTVTLDFTAADLAAAVRAQEARRFEERTKSLFGAAALGMAGLSAFGLGSAFYLHRKAKKMELTAPANS